MHEFSFVQVSDEKSAISDYQPGTRYLAGGTTLIDLIKLNVETPTRLIDINPIPLSKIEDMPDGGLRIGAMVRNSDCAHDPRVISRYPMLSQAILAGASGQLRNMATTGGNIMQRTRCYYFRDVTWPCNKRDPGSGCSAIDGFNRIHAVLGGSRHCIATHPSDMCVAMAALDSVVVIHGRNGERRVALTDFHVLPGDHPERETALEPGELITAVEIPPLPFATSSVYIKVRDRASYAFALASAAVALNVADGIVHDVRIALGGVGTKPWRAHEAERHLVGRPASVDSYRDAADVALRDAEPRKDNAFKVELAKRTLVRALRLTPSPSPNARLGLAGGGETGPRQDK